MNAYIIDTKVLNRNIDILANMTSSAKVWSVVKGDGYGLGMISFAEILAEHGLTDYAITMPQDAALLRKETSAKDILMLRVTDNEQELQTLSESDAILTIGSERSFLAAENAAKKAGKQLRAHLYFDCGMCREGFDCAAPEEAISFLQRSDLISIEGIYTHFPRSGGPEADTLTRFAAFQKAVEVVKASGWAGQIHCSNSLTAMRFPQMHLDAVRLGSGFLGRITYDGAPDIGLRPVGYLECDISDIRTIHTGDTVGYGCAWKASRPSRIAVLDIGTFEGYNTEISREYFSKKDYFRAALSPIRKLLTGDKRLAEVNGKKVPVVGRVAMQHTMLDVTDIPCAVHDKAILPCSPMMVHHVERQYR